MQQAEILVQGGFVAITGLVIVFFVLSLFFVTIKVMQRFGRSKE
jgi:Na+-transporting methylmalonyl-CoA/oxaloacetate decarboxylase gamma subunit